MPSSKSPTQIQSDNRPEAVADIALQAVADATRRLRFGTIQLTVHDGKIVQLDVTERQRFT
jgi:hypothetical protein